MSRSNPDWIGKNDDQKPPQRVRARVFLRADGKCGQCGRQIRGGESWTLEHIVALCNGGANAEHNLGVTCSDCLPKKNAADVAEKSRVARKRAKHLGIAPKKSRPMMGAKASGWKRTFSGEWIKR